ACDKPRHRGKSHPAWAARHGAARPDSRPWARTARGLRLADRGEEPTGSCRPALSKQIFATRHSGARAKRRSPESMNTEQAISLWSVFMDSGLAASRRPGMTASPSLHVVAIARDGIDDGDLLHREVGDDLGAILVHDEHLLDAHAPAEFLSVLGLEREHHAGLDLDGVVERPDAR